MTRLRTKLTLTAVTAAAAVALVLAAVVPATAQVAEDRAVRTFEVTIINLTNGQPLTPPLVATHKARIDLFDVGDPASFELKEIAENGNLDPAVTLLSGIPAVRDVVVSPGGPLVPFGTPGAAMFSDRSTFEITTSGVARRVSMAAMLICTNDGFVGVDSLVLPRRLGQTKIVVGDGYDAGTEINTEDFADMVPPCQDLIGVSSGDPGTGTSDPALAEGGVIAHHAGILGGDDLLPDVHGWDDPGVLFIVTRTS